MSWQMEVSLLAIAMVGTVTLSYSMWKPELWLYALCLAALLGASEARPRSVEPLFPKSVMEDAHMTTLELLTKYNYPAEAHFVVTEDNYILQMDRIPRPGAQPVLLVHGLTDSSAAWILMGPHSSLGYYLYDAGYDVWMGNTRGNRYSRNHTKLNPDKDQDFWSFSWHEIGFYDLPAMIDAVLSETGYKKLTYFGHSQGTTSYFVMASLRPTYNSKVHLMHALAPVAFMDHAKAPRIGLARAYLLVFGERSYELLPHNDMMMSSCMYAMETLTFCLSNYWQLVGPNLKELNLTMFPVILGHSPAGGNVRQVTHYLQMKDSGRFSQFDFGRDENKLIYGLDSPPDYPLQHITSPIALYYSKNDYLSSVVDVQRLAKLLPNVVKDHLYPYKRWNHMDVLSGISARKLAHPLMIEMSRLWEAGGPRAVNLEVEDDNTVGSNIETPEETGDYDEEAFVFLESKQNQSTIFDV